MIRKSLSEISEADLSALVADGVTEGRTIEYKRDLPGGSDADKKEFLADVSSFANTTGGDLIFGIDEEKGLPTQISGIAPDDLDAQIRRLESMLAAGLSPRVRYSTKVIPVGQNRSALLVRIERSWAGPHRVIFQGHDRFYGRNSAGKYPLDVNELRAAFNLSATTIERIRAFRIDRLIALTNNETPMPFADTPKIILHCIPVDAFAGETRYDVLPLYRNPAQLRPMSATAWDRRLNLEGVITFGSYKPCDTYTQIYRTGVVEAVHGNLLAHEHKGEMFIASIAYEQELVHYLDYCFGILKQLGCPPPVAVGLAFTRTRGLQMVVDRMGFHRGSPITQANITLPEAVVEDLATPATRVLKPLLNLVWNACGFEGSMNFDAEDNWVNRLG